MRMVIKRECRHKVHWSLLDHNPTRVPEPKAEVTQPNLTTKSKNVKESDQPKEARLSSTK